MTEAVFLEHLRLAAAAGAGRAGRADRADRSGASSATWCARRVAAQMRSELEHRFEVGGLAEAAVRALVYIRLPEGSVDERGFAALKQIRASCRPAKRMSLSTVQGDVAGAVPARAPRRGARDRGSAEAAAATDEPAREGGAGRCCAASSPRAARLSDEGTRRLARIEALFGVRVGEAARRRSRGGPCLTPATNRSPARHDKYERLIEGGAEPCRRSTTAVAHPCDEVSLEGAVEAARLRPDRADPGRAAGAHPRRRRTRPVSTSAAFELVGFAAQPRFGRQGGRAGDARARAEALMKGSLHTDELMGAVVSRDRPASAPRAASAIASSWTCPAIPMR